MKTRYFSRSEISARDTWRLVEWCAAYGASEFTVSRMSLRDHAAPFVVQFDAALVPFRAACASRELMTVLAGRSRVQPVDLWTVTPESVKALRQFFADGLFDYLNSPGFKAGWLEDPTFYRRGEVMLGVISHEGIGLLTLTPSEHAAVAALGIPTHAEPDTY